ncbi:MAG: DUF2179 domain-containing protein [Bacteroidales bacterium]|nr:DUF2179 domain-containing protein [Bacteroidales bacterium]
MEFIDSNLFTYFILPLLIFLSRIIDVSIGTLRIIFVSRGHKFIAPLLGFFEVLVWIIVIGKIMQNLNNFACYFAYAAGFATGNYIGMLIEEKLAIGIMIIRIITQKNASLLINSLNDSGYGITSIDAHGSKEDVNIIYTIVQRHDIADVINIIKKFNPKAFYSVEDVKFVNEGVFPFKRKYNKSGMNIFMRWRRGK